MALDAYKAFSEKKKCAAAFIDIEGAFDAVWRDGLIYKLQKLGVKGRLPAAIINYFDMPHSCRCFVNSWT